MKFRKSSSSKVSRILGIIKLSYSGRIFSKQELADKYGVSLRTIQRDIKDIKKEIEDFKILDDIKYSNKSRRLMIKDTLLELSKSFGTDFYNDAKKIIGEENKNSFHIMPVMPQLRSDVKNKHFNDYIKKSSEAIEMCRKLRIDYSNGERIISGIVVSPLNVLYCDGFLYLLCVIDDSDDKERTYRFDRIVKMELTDDTFVSTFDFKKLDGVASIWGITDTHKNMKVRLRAYNWAMDFFRNFNIIKNQVIVEKGNFIEVSGYIDNVFEIVPHIMKFIPNVEVLVCDELKREIKNRINEYKKKYDR
jgi:predicted DNA-binding transcriptional regulator YafY